MPSNPNSNPSPDPSPSPSPNPNPNPNPNQVVLVFERTEDSVQRVQSAGSRVRLDDDNNDEDWDLGGTSVGGVSTPIRPKPDKF